MKNSEGLNFYFEMAINGSHIHWSNDKVFTVKLTGSIFVLINQN